jgi:hypothetical protein
LVANKTVLAVLLVTIQITAAGIAVGLVYWTHHLVAIAIITAFKNKTFTSKTEDSLCCNVDHSD